jgi:hypothetical protein
MIKIKGSLLEVSEVGEYEGTKYASLKLRSESSNNRILKYKINLNQASHEKIEKLLDKVVTIDCELVPGQFDAATLRVVDCNITS